MAQELYPIGTQSFEMLRNDGCIYVDKTKYIYDLAHSGARTFFLSRPRRFGKSLLLSTFEAYFNGRKDLFEGLAIYDLENDWESYPVLHFDLSAIQALSLDKLEKNLEYLLQATADKYGVTLKLEGGIGSSFGFLIGDIVKKTGKQVVILIDEYDKGIVDVLANAEQLELNQNIMRPFFAQIKAQNANIRFSLITGVTRFRHYTLFSGFNNPDDLSMQGDYAAICGITMDELTTYFPQGIQRLADKLGISHDEAVDRLKDKYDGNRFTDEDTLVFNPFDIINCLKSSKIENFWLKSGTSKVFVDYLMGQEDFDLTSLTNLWVSQERMEGTFKKDDPIPLLFQTGYLTIKDYDDGLYRLDIPNGEVRSALVNELVPQYLGVKQTSMPTKLHELKRKLNSGDVDGLMRELTALIANVPYHEFDYKDIEKTYHLIVYSLFLMMGVDVRSEIAMSGGRIDMVASTYRYVYVMEFKLDDTAQSALEQIDSHGYALPWLADGRKVFKIGVSFSSATHTIAEWLCQ